jgi:polygalacturonase
VTEDIVIRDCTFLHGHGCTIGSGERGGLRNVTVRNCTFQGCDVGINFESARDRGSLIENIDVSDITMTGVGEAIMLCDYYPNGALIVRSKSTQAFNDLVNGQRDSAQPITSTTPRWRNISIRNVDATCIWEAGLILGLPEMPIENIHLHDVRISAPEGLHISYVKGITLDDVQIFAKRGPPLMVSETVEGLKRD